MTCFYDYHEFNNPIKNTCDCEWTIRPEEKMDRVLADILNKRTLEMIEKLKKTLL